MTNRLRAQLVEDYAGTLAGPLARLTECVGALRLLPRDEPAAEAGRFLEELVDAFRLVWCHLKEWERGLGIEFLDLKEAGEEALLLAVQAMNALDWFRTAEAPPGSLLAAAREALRGHGFRL